jgi:hypothetical protein
LVDGDPVVVPPVERRPFQRKRVLLNGIVVYANGSHTFDCSFRNVSSGGARIRIGRNMQFPSQFYLIAVRDRLAHKVIIIWNNGSEVGVKFIQQISLENNGGDPSHSHLRALWLEKAPR